MPETKRIITSAKVKFPIYLQFIKQSLTIVFGEPPYNLKTGQRITRRLLREAKSIIRKPSPLEEALKYAEVLKEPSIVSKAQVGERFGISRARVCQILSLLELDKSIQKYLLSIQDVKEHNFFTERKLSPITIIKNRNEQIRKFRELVREMVELNEDQ